MTESYIMNKNNQISRIIIILLVSFCAFGLCGKELLTLPCDNSPLERSHIVQDHQSFYDMGLNCRITDVDRFVVYRFDAEQAELETIRLKIANSYKISLSRDGREFTPFAVADQIYRGLSNMGDIELDVKEFLRGAKEFYLRSEHMDPTQGFGGCLFSITLNGSGTLRSPRPRLESGELRDETIVLDGTLNEAAWKNAQWYGNFSLYNSAEIPTQPTYVAMRHDEENFYFGFKCYDARIAGLETIVTQRDGNIFSDNCVEIFLQPGAGRPYWHFAANSGGVQFDSLASADGKNDDRSWNARWESAATLQGDRWELEIAIPWSELGIVPEEGMSFGINFTRNAGAYGEMTSLVPISGSYHRPECFGLVTLSNGEPGPSFGVNARGLNGNPPAFEFLTQAGNAPESRAAQVTIDFFPSDRQLGFAASEPVLSRTLAVETSGNTMLSDDPLPPGSYLAALEWTLNGRNRMRQLIPVLLPAEDNNALTIEMRQSVYQDEPAIAVEYRCRVPGARTLAWRITDEQGRELSRGEEPVTEKTGVITADLPEEIGTYQLEVRLPEQPELRRHAGFTKIPVQGTPTEFSISDNGGWKKNGEDFYPLVLCLALDMPEAAKSGFNMVILGSDLEGTPETVEANRNILDEAHANGLYVMLHLCNLFRGREDFEGLKLLVASLKNHPALGAWYLADEPSGTATSPRTLQRAAEIIRAIDSRHPIAGCDNSPLMFEAFSGIFDVFMPDPYPVPHNEIREVTDWIQRSFRVMEPGTSIVPYLQGQGQPFFPRGPNEQEIRNMTLQALACGSQGLAWWAHGPMRDSGEWPVFVEMVQMCRTLAPRLHGVKPEYRNEGDVVFSRFHSPAGSVVIAVNLTSAPAKADLPWPTPEREIPGGTGVTRNGSTLELAPYGCAVWAE